MPAAVTVQVMSGVAAAWLQYAGQRECAPAGCGYGTISGYIMHALLKSAGADLTEL